MSSPSNTDRRTAARAARRRARRLAWLRLGLLAAGAVVAFILGAAAGATGDDPRRARAQAFGAAWARGDYRAMYALLSPARREQIPLERFSAAYRDTAAVATIESVRSPGPVGAPDDDGIVRLPVVLKTRVFGTQRGTIALPVVHGDDDDAWVEWNRSLTYPGLRRGEKLTRNTRMPPRAAIQARDGTVLAQGPERAGNVPSLASDIAGGLGPAPPEQLAELKRRGLPADTPVGLSGLEREFERQLAGTPGGQLLAGNRVLAAVQPIKGSAVRATIDPQLQSAAVTALAGRLGGVAVIRPRDGEVLALAGIAFSSPQAPGSVFKIITLAAGLEAGVAKPSNEYPVETFTVLEGVELDNNNKEPCGGSLANSFANSCNSVFAPMGAKVGAKRLVAMAERFGFNSDLPIIGAARSTIPAASEIGDDLAVGSTAIGQGQTLATPLLFATIAGTIGLRGERVGPTLRKGAATDRKRLLEPARARLIADYMRRVVTDGSGTAAQIEGIKVAGKTGTAELRDAPDEESTDPDVPPPAEDLSDTNAWFVAFAPYKRPRVAVAVMLAGQGTGGGDAAPIAKQVIEAALR